MKILFVSQNFHPESFSNNRIASRLAQSGHQVTVLTAVPNYPEGQFPPGYSNSENRVETWQGVTIHRARTIPRGKSAVKLLLNYITFPITAAWQVLRRKFQPDVIFVSQLSPIFMIFPAIVQKWLTRAPLVVWVQDIWPESATFTLNLKNPLIVKPLHWLSGWLYRRADLILVQSAAFPPMISRFGISENRIRVMPNSAPELFRPVPPDPATAALLPSPDFKIIFAGNIGESQDFDSLIATADALRDRALHWYIIGSGRDRARIETEIARLDLSKRFTFLGRYPEDQMPQFFAHADALIVSLKSNAIFDLTVPYKVQCYMAVGKPIIGALNGEGARVLAQAKAGVVAPASDPTALAREITALMEMTESQRQTLGKNGRDYFLAHYSQEIVEGILQSALLEAAKTTRP